MPSLVFICRRTTYDTATSTGWDTVLTYESMRRHVGLQSCLVVFVLISTSGLIIRSHDEVNHTGQDTVRRTVQSFFWNELRHPVLVPELIHRRHFGFINPKSKGFFHRRVSCYPNSDSTFQLTRLFISWDINLNPGPNTEKASCHTCSRTIVCNHRSLACNGIRRVRPLWCSPLPVRPHQAVFAPK